MVKVWTAIAGLIIGLAVAVGPCFAVTAQQLQYMMNRGEDITIIDIRNSSLYTDGHIPGAINMPASVIAIKRIPAIGAVVVYGDGINLDMTSRAVDSLNARDGITAEALDGGFSAWEAVSLQTTYESGLGREHLRFLTYQEFEKLTARNSKVVLVDLRSAPLSEITDLSQKFSGLHVIRLERDSQMMEWDIASDILSGRKGNLKRSFYVMIDDGDGESEKVARRMKAAGFKRIAILAGGELTLSKEGKTGFKTIRRTE